MRKLKVLSLLLSVTLLLSVFAPFASADILDYATAVPATDSQSVLLMELTSGRELFSQNADAKAYPASTTKILTVLLAIEAVERGAVTLDDMVTAKAGFKEGISEDASSAGIKEGESMSLRDLLYCAMLPSANEACNVIAMYISGSVSDFVALMNRRANELGCTGSHFTNTNGMPDEEHYTTARDLYLISAEAIKHEEFKKICGTASYITAATNMTNERELHNSNALICEDSVYGKSYIYDGAYGIKTGRTDAAGLCLVSAAKRGDVDLLCVVLGADEDFTNKVFDSFGDTVKLFDWAFGNFSYRCLLEKGTAVGAMHINLAENVDEVGLVAADDVIAFAPMGLTAERIVFELVQDTESLDAPVKAGTVVGTVKVCDEYGTVYGEVELKTESDVELDVGAYLEDYSVSLLKEYWIVLAGALVFIIALVFILVLVRHKNKRNKKKYTPKKVK